MDVSAESPILRPVMREARGNSRVVLGSPALAVLALTGPTNLHVMRLRHRDRACNARQCEAMRCCIFGRSAEIIEHIPLISNTVLSIQPVPPDPNRVRLHDVNSCFGTASDKLLSGGRATEKIVPRGFSRFCYLAHMSRDLVHPGTPVLLTVDWVKRVNWVVCR